MFNIVSALAFVTFASGAAFVSVLGNGTVTGNATNTTTIITTLTTSTKTKTTRTIFFQISKKESN